MMDRLTVDQALKQVEVIQKRSNDSLNSIAAYHYGEGYVDPCARVLAEEVNRLRTIVDKLPKTADDVPVIPGEIYHAVTTWEDCDDPPVVMTVKYVGHAQPWIEYKWACVSDGHDVEEFKVISVYSTKELADVKAQQMEHHEQQ